MNYEDMLSVAKTGDMLLAQSTGVAGLFIRLATLSSYTHVAVVDWGPDEHRHEAYVQEMVEMRGHNMSLLRNWCLSRWKSKQKLYLLVSPPETTQDPVAASKWLRHPKHTDAKYGYGVLPIIWLVLIDKRGWIMPKMQRLFRIKTERLDAVCSIFAARFWKAQGYTIDTIIAPNRIAECPDARGLFQITPSDNMVEDKIAVAVSK